MQKAQTIVNNAQSAPERGWKAFESDKTPPLLAQYEGLSGKPRRPPMLEKLIIEEPEINRGLN